MFLFFIVVFYPFLNNVANLEKTVMEVMYFTLKIVIL